MIRSAGGAAATALCTFVGFFFLVSAVLVGLGIRIPFAFAVVLSGSLLAAIGVFRSVFNWLCERWSAEIDPPSIPPCRMPPA